MTSDELYENLRSSLKELVDKHNLYGEKIPITFRSLSVEEAIGDPLDRDYPIILGKEKMIEASFRTGRGQAFTDEYGNGILSIHEMLTNKLDTNRDRANFIAAINAIYRHFGLCCKTVHCKDEEPIDCGKELLKEIDPNSKVLLVGLQPRLLQSLASRGQKIRVVDMDQDSVGEIKFGIQIEATSKTDDLIEWCDVILATGSTIVNNTMTLFINSGKPTIFFGITAAAPAQILNLNTFCAMGH